MSKNNMKFTRAVCWINWETNNWDSSTYDILMLSQLLIIIYVVTIAGHYYFVIIEGL